MRNLMKSLSVVYLLFLIFPAPSNAGIKSVKIQSDDRSLIVFDSFEFTNTGFVSVSISSVSVTTLPVTSSISRPDLSRIGFYLIADDAWYYMYSEKKNISCELDSKFISLLFTFKDLSIPSQSSFNKSHAVTYPNVYTLKFANCNPLSHVTMDVQTELYNTNNDTTKDYLSAGQTHLPSLFHNFSIIYLCSLGISISLCFKNRRSFHWIHLLMGVLLVMKVLNLLYAAYVQQYMKVTGIYPHGWNNDLLYVIQFIRNVLFCTIISVIFNGSSFSNPVKISLMIVTPLQIFATLASKLQLQGLPEESTSWESWFLFTNMFCNMVLITPIANTIFCCETSKTVAKYLAKFILIRVFFVVFNVYWFTDIVLRGGGSDFAKAVEITSLLFYMVMFYIFRPSMKNVALATHEDCGCDHIVDWALDSCEC